MESTSREGNSTAEVMVMVQFSGAEAISTAVCVVFFSESMALGMA